MEVELVIAARKALDALAAADLDSCDRDMLDVVLEHWRTLRSFSDVCDVRIARRSRELAAQGRSETVEGILAQRGRRGKREARDAARREQACEQMPCFEKALADGAVATGHLDALAAATHGLDDDAQAAFVDHAESLLGLAEWQSVEAFTRECDELARNVSHDEGESRLERQKKDCRVRQWVDRITGMHHIHAELDAESGAKAWTAINAVAASMRHAATEAGESAAEPHGPTGRRYSWDWYAAQALIELVTGARSVDKRVPEVAVLVDWRTLCSGLHERSLCETSEGTMLPPSTVRRLCCEAEIFPAVLGGHGEVVDLGRSQRLANRAQRRALRAMYRTCGFPGCDVSFDRCEIHHIEWWENFGPTDLQNLLPLCSRHHHVVHEDGWTLRIGPHREITLTRPDGVVHFRGATVDRGPPASLHRRRRGSAA
jgi:hypothetical protein